MSKDLNRVYEISTAAGMAGVGFSEVNTYIFDYADVDAINVEKSNTGIMPWGADNLLPVEILTKIEADEVMVSNNLFNAQCGYGMGVKPVDLEGEPSQNEEVKTFIRRNDLLSYWFEQQIDIKTWFFTVAVIILSNDGKKIVKLYHKEANHCRFEKANDKGIIENVFYTDWENDDTCKKGEKIALLNHRDPFGDLMVRMGLEIDDRTGKKQSPTKDRKFAIVCKIPTPGHDYYPHPPYWSVFLSKWYDIKALIPKAKYAKMYNGMSVRFLVEINQMYWTRLYEAERISDPEKQKARKKTEIQNILDFVSGAEKSGKTWFTSFYVDPNGKEQSMVKITRIDNTKEGGDYIEDSEEASNIICYTQGVHPSLVGAVPGKNKGGFSGSDKRELFTMKQALEHPFRDILMKPLNVIKDFNKWNDVEFHVPDIMLTTLDKGTDAQPTPIPIPINNDTNND